MSDDRAVREPRTADWRLRVKSLREERNLSGAAVAAMAGISRAHLWSVETGTKEPSVGVAWRIAAALGISLAELLREDGLDVERLTRALQTYAQIGDWLHGEITADTAREVAVNLAAEYLATQPAAGERPPATEAIVTTKELGRLSAIEGAARALWTEAGAVWPDKSTLRRPAEYKRRLFALGRALSTEASGEGPEPWIGPNGEGRPSMADDRSALGLSRSDLELIDAEASTAHDYIWNSSTDGRTEPVTREQASDAIWSIHNLVRAALSAPSTEASGEGLREGIEAELAMLPPESKMRQFDMGAAAAYNHVLSLLPAAATDPSHPTPEVKEVST
jgi:transcriptional regulator with XRE-family HTH domain